MTNLVGPVPNTKGDVLTTTNGGQGLNTILSNVQDGDGNNSAILLSTQQLKVAGGFLANRTPVTVPVYNALITDYLLAVTVNAGGVTINLPAPSIQNIGQTFIVQDEVGNAGVGGHHITVQVTGGANIGANPTSTIDVNYSDASFYTNGVQYF